jgi:hypothetical protein
VDIASSVMGNSSIAAVDMIYAPWHEVSRVAYLGP